MPRTSVCLIVMALSALFCVPSAMAQGVQGKEGAGDYVTIEAKGTLAFREGHGYELVVRSENGKPASFSLPIMAPENKLLVGKLASLTGKTVLVKGPLVSIERDGSHALVVNASGPGFTIEGLEKSKEQ